MGFSGSTVIDLGQYVTQVISATFSGPFASSQITSVTLHKIGKLVTMEVPAISAGATLSGVSNASSGVIIPAGYLPQATISGTCVTVSNSLNLGSPGKLTVDTAGNVKIYANLLQSTVFAVLGNNGWERCSLSWIVA